MEKVKHLGIIIDGNRRWARGKGKASIMGHRQGVKAVREVAMHAFDKGVKYVTLYVFSTENWSRKQEEVSGLMSLILEASFKEAERFSKKGIKIIFPGDKNDERISGKVKEKLQSVEEDTKNNKKGTLAICFNYGGQKEIVDAVRVLISEGVKAEDVDEKAISSRLYYPQVPPVDLIIRTSGEQRISNFMLWRAAYSELLFVDKLWPDFTPKDLDEALEDYVNRQRRFGG